MTAILEEQVVLPRIRKLFDVVLLNNKPLFLKVYDEILVLGLSSLLPLSHTRKYFLLVTKAHYLNLVKLKQVNFKRNLNVNVHSHSNTISNVSMCVCPRVFVCICCVFVYYYVTTFKISGSS